MGPGPALIVFPCACPLFVILCVAWGLGLGALGPWGPGLLILKVLETSTMSADSDHDPRGAPPSWPGSLEWGGLGDGSDRLPYGE